MIMITIPVTTGNSYKQRKFYIKSILERGKVVVFTNKYTGVKKYVDKWNIDDIGDLMAYKSTGLTKAVAWDNSQYSISETDKDET